MIGRATAEVAGETQVVATLEKESGPHLEEGERWHLEEGKIKGR